MANEFIIRKGYKSLASSEITGSLSVSGSNITLVGADTPVLNIKDTTNDLTGKIRVANNYVYIEADQGNSVGSTRLVLKTDGTQFLYGDANQNVFIPTGDVGIGTTTASHMLTVRGPVSASTYYGDGSNLSGISVPTDFVSKANGGTFSGNVNVFPNASTGTFRVGRYSGQEFKLHSTDTINTITSIQDADENQTHNFTLDREHAGSGANNFKIQKDGSDQLSIDKDGLVTIGGSFYAGQTSDYFGSATVIQLNSGASNKNVGIRSNILYLYAHGNGSDAALVFGDGSANFSLVSSDTDFNLYNYGTSTNALTVLKSNNKATFAGNVEVDTVFKVNAPDGGSSPAMTATINMHGYDGRGVGIKMKDNITTTGGGDDNEWFIGTGYNQSGFNIGYAADGSQSSYSAQAKLQIGTNGNATFAGDITISNATPALNLTDTDNSSNIALSSVGGALVVNSPSDQVYQYGGVEKFRISTSTHTSAAHIVPGTDSTYNIGSASSRFSVGYFDSLQITNVVTNKILKFDGSDIDDSIMTDDGSTVSVAGDMTVTGTLTAQEFKSELVSASIVYESGSTKFGDTSNDVHSFSGSLRVTGSGAHYFTNGDVGIGTATPGVPLHVYAAESTIKLQSSHGREGSINQGGGNLHLHAAHGSGVAINYGNTSHPGLLKLYNNTTSKVQVNANGDSYYNGGSLGVGTTSPIFAFHVNSAATNTSIGIGNTSSGVSRLYIDASNGDFAGSDYMWLGQNNDLSGEIFMAQNAGSFNIKSQPGGTARTNVTVTQAGDVGIGSTSPEATLDVRGDGADFFLQSADFKIARIQPRGTGANLDKGLLSLFDGSVEDVRIDTEGSSWFNGGLIGIGTTSPNALLNLSQANGANIRFDNETTTNYFTIGEGVGTNNIFSFRGNSYRSTDTLSIDFANDRVGIGVIAPEKRLHVKTATSDATPQVLVQNSSTGDASILLNVSGQSYIFGIDYNDSKKFKIASSGNLGTTDRVTLLSTGQVGIGTITPAELLEVNGSIRVGSIKIQNVSAGGRIGFNRNTADGTIYNSSYEAFQVQSNGSGYLETQAYNSSGTYQGSLYFTTAGKLGIGSSSPGNKLDVMGNVSASAYYGDGSNLTGISGGNATTLDGIDSTSFFRSDAADTAIGFATYTNINSSGDAGLGILSGARLGFDESGTRSWTVKATSGQLQFNSGDGGGSFYLGVGLHLNNKGISGVDALAFNDPGPNEGIAWSGGNFKIYESPNDLTTNTAGSLQFVSGSTRVVSIGKSGETALEVIGSGSTVFEVVGSQGQLFSVTDDLSGTLFAVSDISGTPLLEVDADSTITMGDFGTNALVVTGSKVGVGTSTPSVNLEVKSIQDSSFDEGIGVVRSNTSQTGYINMVGGAMNINAPNAIPIKFRDGGNTNLTIGGDGVATFGSNVLLADNKELIFGAATDYKIYHNSTTNVNHISSLIDRQLSLNANIINFTNQANDSTVMVVSGSRVKVGGNHAATSQLHIKNTSGDNRGLMVENSVAASYAEVALKSDTREFRLGTGGSGTSNANAQNLFYIYDATTGGAAGHRFEINSNGDVQARRTRSNTAGEVALSVQPTDSTIHYGFRIDQTTNSINLDRVDSAGQLLRVDTSGNATFTGYVKSPYYTSDSNGKFYAWRAIENTGSTSNLYFRIAKITGGQSSRFSIELTGRSTSYSDGTFTAWGKLVGQLNNDNNYDLTYYDFKTADSEVVTEIGQVDVSTTQTSIYVKIGQFAEIAATAYVSDGSITTYDTNDGSSSAPTGYVAAARSYTMWHSGNDGASSGLDADTVDGVQLTGLVRLDHDNAGEVRGTNFKANTGGVYYAYTSAGNLRGYMYATDTDDEHLVLRTSGGEDIAFKDDTTTNLIIRGDGSMIEPGGQFINTVSSGTNIDVRKGAGSGAVGFGGTAHQTGLIEGVDGGGLKLYTAGNDVNWGGAWTLGTTWSGDDMSQAGRISGGEHIMAANNVYANGTQGFVFGQSVSEGEYIYRSGNDIRIYAGGADRLTVDGDAGYVGIGTTAPGTKFDVAGANATIWINPADGAHAGLHFRQAGAFKGFVGYNDSTDVVNLSMDGSISNGINVNSSHNVGIGTTTPGAKLQVIGSGSTVFDVQGSQGQLFSITDDLTGDLFAVSDISGVPIFNVNASGEVKIDGKLGIGATAGDFHADADNLVVGDGVGNTGITIHSGTTGFGSIFFADGTANDATEKRGQIRYLQGTERMDFHTDNVATAALSLAANSNATFAGSVDVGTFTLAGSGIVADAGMTLQIGGGSVNAITLANSSGNATFAGAVDIRGSGYNQIKIANTLTANTNKQSGIITENYEGNNVSIFQTFQQNNSNAIYYGSADGSFRGMQNHYFMVNADSDTAASGHTTALHIASNTNATFAGDVGMATGHSSGKFAVMSSAVHGSYDFYNNGTSYFNGNVIVNANLTVDAGNISLTADGSNAVTFTESGAGLLTIAAPDDIKLDANSDIILDANGADIRLSDNGTEVGVINMASSNLTISSKVSDKDIILEGNDGGTTIQMLKLDSSNGGSATFRDDVDVGGHIYGKSVNNAFSELYRFGGIYFTWDSDSYGTNLHHSITSTDNGTYSDKMTWNSYGKVRINFDSNNNDTGDFRIGHHTTGTANTLLTLTSAGTLTVTGDVVAFSDERLKSDVKTLDGTKVYDMRGVSFTKDDKQGSGVIAQELEKVAPELVHEHDEYKSVAYGNLTGYLIEAVKDLKKEIEELKGTINKLQSEK